MKQYQYVKPSGVSHGPFGPHHASFMVTDSKALQALSVGATWTDVDGDVWTRLPDRGTPTFEPQVATDVAPELEARAQMAKRLERIATAALQGLLASPNTGRATGYMSLAEEAVATAQALIAELDKQS